MQDTDNTIRLWCFCFEYAAGALIICVNGDYGLRHRTPLNVCVITHRISLNIYFLVFYIRATNSMNQLQLKFYAVG